MAVNYSLACKIILSALTNVVVKITSGKDLILSRFSSLIKNMKASRHNAFWKPEQRDGRFGARGAENSNMH